MFRQKQNTLPSTPTSQTCSPASFLQLLHTGQTELAQNCVSRLKKQRQKVEEVTQVCLSQDRQLQMYRQRVSELQEEVESGRSAGLYLQAYEELKEEFEQLYQKYEQIQHQHQQDLQEQAEKMASLRQQLQENQKNQLRGRDEMALMETYWQEILADKDNQYRKLQRELEIGQQRGREQAEQWRNRCRELQISIEERKAEHRSREKSSRKQSKAKDNQIQRMRKVVALHERQCGKEREKERLRRREQWEDERQELRDRNQQLQLMVASLRKQLTQKIMEGEKLRQVLGKLEVKCQRLEDHVQSISLTPAAYGSTACGRRDRECRCEEEQVRGDKLEREVERLQRQLRRHVEDYSRVEAELKRRERAQERRQSSIPSRGISAHR